MKSEEDITITDLEGSIASWMVHVGLSAQSPATITSLSDLLSSFQKAVESLEDGPTKRELRKYVDAMSMTVRLLCKHGMRTIENFTGSLKATMVAEELRNDVS